MSMNVLRNPRACMTLTIIVMALSAFCLSQAKAGEQKVGRPLNLNSFTNQSKATSVAKRGQKLVNCRTQQSITWDCMAD